MKKILLFLTVFLLVSCASKPKPEPDPIPEPRPEPPAKIVEQPVTIVEPVIVESTEGLEVAKSALVDADTARQRALSVKAQNAAKADFMVAQALYDDGKSAYGKKDYPVAAGKWTESIPVFNISHDNALVARDRALAALEDAQKAIDDAETTLSADNAETVEAAQ